MEGESVEWDLKEGGRGEKGMYVEKRVSKLTAR